jgi:predicted nucleic acid-binding Zn finger protein
MAQTITSGKTYITTEQGCTCPDYIYRQSKVVGGQCKHQRALLAEKAATASELKPALTVAEINELLFG